MLGERSGAWILESYSLGLEPNSAAYTSPCLSFPICVMELLIVLTSQGGSENRVKDASVEITNTCMLLIKNQPLLQALSINSFMSIMVYNIKHLEPCLAVRE